MRISVSLSLIIFYCHGLQIAHADQPVGDQSSCGELQGTLSDEIKPNSSSCSDDLQCDTGAAFDKNVSTVTIASPMGNTSPKLSWIKFKLDKVYYISEIKVLLCKDGQNKLTIDTYMKMEHLENVAKVQSEQNRKEQIFRPTSLADKIIITNINKKIVISEIIILGMAACELPKNIWINVTHSNETNPNNGDTVKFEYTDTSGDVVCISANCYKGTYHNVTRCDTTITVCLPLQTTDNEALRASLEVLMSSFPIDVGKLDHNGRSGYVKTTIICHDNGTLSSPQSFIEEGLTEHNWNIKTGIQDHKTLRPGNQAVRC